MNYTEIRNKYKDIGFVETLIKLGFDLKPEPWSDLVDHSCHQLNIQLPEGVHGYLIKILKQSMISHDHLNQNLGVDFLSALQEESFQVLKNISGSAILMAGIFSDTVSQGPMCPIDYHVRLGAQGFYWIKQCSNLEDAVLCGVLSTHTMAMVDVLMNMPVHNGSVQRIERQQALRLWGVHRSQFALRYLDEAGA